ncbi:MAG: flagellar hook-length control protein FliK [Planctomycetota bacterium]
MDINVGSVHWEGNNGPPADASFLLRLSVGERVRARVNGGEGSDLSLTVRGRSTRAIVRSGPTFRRGDLIELEVLQNDGKRPVFRFLGFVSGAQTTSGSTNVPAALPADVQAALAEIERLGAHSPDSAEALLRLLGLPTSSAAVSVLRAFMTWRRLVAKGTRRLTPDSARVLRPTLEAPADAKSIARQLRSVALRLARPLELELLRGTDPPSDPRAVLAKSALPAEREVADQIQGQELAGSALPFVYVTLEQPSGRPIEIALDRPAHGAGDPALRARVRVRLERLGLVEASLQLRGADLTVGLTTESHRAAELFEKAAEHLSGPLSANGLRLARLEALADPTLAQTDFWAREIAEVSPAPARGGLDLVV